MNIGWRGRVRRKKKGAIRRGREDKILYVGDFNPCCSVQRGVKRMPKAACTEYWQLVLLLLFINSLYYYVRY
jgi:hypothetical protein